MTTRRAPSHHTSLATPSGPATSGARVWSWHIPAGTYTRADLELLDPSERMRLEQLKSASAAAEYISCRAAARRILGDFFEVPVTEISFGRHVCPGCGSDRHGPPKMVYPKTNWQISISHSSGLGMLAAAPFRVGVDAEAVRAVPVEEITDSVLTRREHGSVFAAPRGLGRARAFLRCWTRKEAVLKAVGIGIVTDLTELETRAWAPGPAEVTTGAPAAPATWRVSDVPVPDGWTAALAQPADAAGDVTVRRL